MEPIGALDQRFDIGRALVFDRDTWDGTDAFFDDAEFEHTGDTEGEITIEANPEYSELTLTELTGPAAIKRYLKGERPTFTLGLFPTPETMRRLSPTGLASAGMERQAIVRTRSLWVVPEALFLKPDANGFNERVPVTYTGGAFLKDGIALTSEEQDLVELSMIIWKADIQRVTPRYSDADGGKALREVEVVVQQQFIMPNGCQLWLMLGDLDAFPTLDLEGFIS
jgi:hypothetical protein